MITFNNQNNQDLATVKKPNTNEVISKEEFNFRVNELKKCKEDIIYFAKNYFKLISLKDGLVTINPYPKQEELIKFFTENKRTVILSSRQSGKTTSYTVFALWILCFYPNKSIMLAANKATTAIEILGRIRLALEYLPIWLKPGVVTYNKTQIVLNNNTKIFGFATSSDATRGFSANIILLDEFAYVPNNIAKEFFASVLPVAATDPDSRVIIVSTPNGTQNLYYDIWKQANENILDISKKDSWQPFRMDWWDVPSRDDKWKQQQIDDIGINRFRVEFGNEFVGGSDSRLINSDFIDEQKRNYKKSHNIHIKLNEEETYTVNINHHFEFGKIYIAGADIGEGLGLDYSVLTILDITDFKKIKLAAMARTNKLSVSQFALLSARILNAYGLPLLLCESNGIGAGFLSQLNNICNYPRLARYDMNKEENLGIHTTAKIKIEAILWLRELLITSELGFEFNDLSLIDELAHFSKIGKTGSKYGAPKGMNDDIVLSLIWNLYLLKPNMLRQAIDVLNTINTSTGLEIPSSIKYKFESDKFKLDIFDKDDLPLSLSKELNEDLYFNWYGLDGVTPSLNLKIVEEIPQFYVNNSYDENIKEVKNLYDMFYDEPDELFW